MVMDNAGANELSVRSGISPDEVEIMLDMAAASGAFSPDSLLNAQDLAWGSAYGDGSEPHSFLRCNASGFICFGPLPHWPGSYELYGIVVDQNARRRGIGSTLIAAMIKQVREAGGERILLETGSGPLFEGVHRFYEANGFECGRFCKQFIPDEFGVVYRLDLPCETLKK